MKPSEEKQEFKAGVFVLIGLGLTLAAILVLGGKQSFFSSVNDYYTHFNKIDGLVSGAKVVLGGLQIGVVKEVDFDETTRDILVKYSAERKYSKWIRQDSTVEIVTQGVLGDKYLSINSGTPDQPIVKDGGTIAPGGSKDISQLFNSSEQLMTRLSATAENLTQVLEAFNKGDRANTIFQGLSVASKNLSEVSVKLNQGFDQSKVKSAVHHLNSILEKVNHGRGSVGAFINDPALYDDAKALVGQVNRNRIMRNLIRQTIKDNKEEAEDEVEKASQKK